MRPLDLNLAHRPYRNNTLLWIVTGLAVLALVAGTVWEVRSFLDYSARLKMMTQDVSTFDEQEEELEQRDRAARKEIATFDLAVLEGQVRKANDVIERKAFSWTGLFNQLEACQPNDVKMVTIRPEFGRSRTRRGGRAQLTSAEDLGFPVAIEAIAKNFPSVLDMQNQLFESPHFGRVEMERISKSDLGTSEYLVVARFMYYPDGSDEAVSDAGDAAEVADETETEEAP
ncbi:MAG: hypothetical protein OEV00_00880 [Acidobacteriota bacterium]|nr:hypothetical protein [Acidobacteriota bacterium]MDH3783859.1 hypothetical protein [Acidobacteriota bacterium]